MANNVLSVWNTIGSVLLALLILLANITIHEFGHYLAGKIFKFKINEFAVGFGPALFKKKRKKSDEIFSVRIFPLGGYCAFAGEDGTDSEEEKGKEDPVFEEESPAPPEGEKEGVPASEGEKESAPAPEKGSEEGKRRRKRLRYTDDGLFTHMKPWKRIIVLVAGAFMNYLLALLLINVLFASYGQTMIAVYRAEAPTEEFPAEYCLQDYDILLEAEGKNLYLTHDLARAVSGKKRGDLVKLRVSRAVGLTWETDPETGNERASYDRREEMTVTVMLRDDVKVKNSADVECVYRALGFLRSVETDENGNESVSYAVASSSYRFGFFETVGRSFVYSFKIAGTIFRVFGELLTGKLGITSLGGPVTTITTTSQVVSAAGLRGFLDIAAFIGVNLAVVNLLPIPALDGSKVVFTLIEWVRGRPINRKVEAVIHAVGIVLLFGFAILVDILQFV